jgi:glycosyltransferase involved in cell wall biosynthesis
VDNKIIKVAWLAPYPIGNLQNAVFSRSVVKQGSGTWLQNLALELVKHDSIELHIICEAGNIPFSQSFSEDRIQFHLIRNTVPFLKRGYPHYLPLQEILCYSINSFRIKKVLDKIKPDIVHAHGTENSYAISALRCKYANIISIQGVLREISKHNPTIRLKLKTYFESLVVRRGKNFICRTNLDSALVSTLNPDGTIFTIYEAMNPVFFKKDWKVNDDCSILFVGSIQERKGIMVLLESLLYVKKSFENVRLYVVGSGVQQNYTSQLKDFCKREGLEGNVFFSGFLTSEEIAEYHLKSQVLVCPSFIENSPNCIAEAMVTGLPVVASNVGGIPSMINDGHTGYLCEADDPLALAGTLSYLLANRSERDHISKNAKRIARKNHLPENVAEKTIRTYKTILNKG